MRPSVVRASLLALLVGGAILITAGVAMVFVPAALIVLGAMLMFVVYEVST